MQKIYILSSWCARRLRNRECTLTSSTFSRFDGSRFFFGWHENRPESRIVSFAEDQKPSAHRLFPMISYIGLSVTTVNPFRVVLSVPIYSGVCSLRVFLVNGSNATRKVIRGYNDLIVNPLSTVWCHQGAITENAADFCILLRYIIAQNASTWLTAVIASLYRIISARLK